MPSHPKGAGKGSLPLEKSEKIAGDVFRPLVGVAGGQIPRDLRAFVDVSADRDGGCRRAGPVGLLEAVIAAVEARDHAGAAVARGGFGIDQRLHFVAPFWAFIGAANAAQIVQGAEDLGQPLQVAVERRGSVLGPRRARIACRYEDDSGQNTLEHDLFFDALHTVTRLAEGVSVRTRSTGAGKRFQRMIRRASALAPDACRRQLSRREPRLLTNT